MPLVENVAARGVVRDIDELGTVLDVHVTGVDPEHDHPLPAAAPGQHRAGFQRAGIDPRASADGQRGVAPPENVRVLANKTELCLPLRAVPAIIDAVDRAVGGVDERGVRGGVAVRAG